MIKEIIKYSALGLVLLIVFLILTFPLERLAPKIRAGLEGPLRSMLGPQVNCDIDGLGFHFPLGISWDALTCDNGPSNSVLDFGQGYLSLFFGNQTLKTRLGKGEITLSSNASGTKSMPTRISGEISKVSIAQILPLALAAGYRANPNVPKGIKAEGLVTAKFDMPLTELYKGEGSFDLKIDGFKLPPQATLDLVGIKGLDFTKAALRGELKAGKFNIREAQFLSTPLSAKVEGSFDFQQDLAKSNPNLTFKFNIQKTDALMAAPFGMMLNSFISNCPSLDPEGFCTKRVQKMAEFNTLFF